MKMDLRAILVAACAATGVHALATDYTWTNTATTAQSWYSPANWVVGDVPATEVPSNATDTATFPAIGYTRRIVNLMTGGGDASIASISGAAAVRLRLNAYSSGTYGYGDVLNFSVKDVNGFAGEWDATGSKKTLVLTAESGVQTLSLVKTTQQFSLKVENAAATADILQLRGTSGSFKKSGAGDVRIREVAEDGNLVLELEEGNVQIDGSAKIPLADDAAVLRKAAVHLDASVSSTWQQGSYVDEAGRTRVTKWNDVHGNGAYAEIWDNSGDGTASHLKVIPPPFVSATQSSTGLSLMDFGARSSANVDTYGPQSLMRLKTRIAAAQEVFVVSALNDGCAVLGDSSGTDFNGNDEYVFTYGTQILANDGFARFNGNRNWQNLATVSGSYRMTRTFDSYTANKNELMLTNVRFGDGNAKPIYYLASDRLYATAGNGTGGVKIGELLIFTEALTEAERKEVTDYLMRKWFAKADHKDFHLVNAADATSITVPEGRVARIDTLRVKGSAFTKKGAGTLQVGRVYPEDLSITVEGGDVKLDTTVATETVSAPVGTPQFWFDADYDASVSFVKDGDNVTNWRDRRNNGQQTSRLDFPQITAYPQVDTESLPGHTVLAFPNKSAMEMPAGGQRESFVAFCYTDNILNYNVIGNGYPTDRSGGGVYGLFAKYDIAPDKMGGGIYSVDGKPVRPFESTGSTFVIGQWHVAHLSTTEAYGMARIASNGGRGNTGHVKIAEIVTYTTALTPEEREKNVDYLMNKWLGKRHPAYERPAKDISVSFAGDAEIGSDTDATFAQVTGSGTFVKTGSGFATVTAELDDSFTDIAVEGGSLTIMKPTEPPDRSKFHFDAMDTASYAEQYVDSEGLLRVSKWLDTRRNGTYAYTPGPVNPSGSNWMYMTNPVVRQVEFPDGVTRPVFDFLTANARNINPPTGAGFYISPAVGDSKIKEAHYIFGNGQSGLRVFHGRHQSHFLRGSNKQLFRNGSQTSPVSLDIQNGYISVNNVQTNSTVVLQDNNFYLVSVAPLAAKDISNIGVDRADQAGGDRYGECIAFTEYLSAKERAYLQTKMMHKWFGAPAPVWTNELSSVSVAADSTLVVSGGGMISAPTVAGGGTIAATKVMGIAELDLVVVDGVVQTLTVDGVASFAPAVSVSLSGAGATTLASGEYTLVSATSLENVDLSAWTLSTAQKRQCEFVRDGSSVKLRVGAPGTILIFR